MLNNLFINGTILVSFIFISSQILNNSKDGLKTTSSKVWAGLMGGILAIMLTFYGLRINDETIVDFRYIPIVLVTFYISPISTIIAAVITISFRIGMYGVSNSSLLGSTAIILIALGCIMLRKIVKVYKLRFHLMLSYSLIIIDIVLIILLRDSLSLIATYSLLYIITGEIVFRLSEYVIQSSALYNQFKYQATTDFLTGLNNAREFDMALNDSYLKAIEYGQNLSILAIDIDHFKSINDTYGHDSGDAVLKQLGSLLNAACRPCDITARVGGEEFSIILINCSNTQAVEAAERIRKLVCNHKFQLPNAKTINISISIGAATYPDSIDNIELLAKQADIELYKAKETGRNKVCSINIKDCQVESTSL